MTIATEEEIIEAMKKFCTNCKKKEDCIMKRMAEKGTNYMSTWLNNNGLIFCQKFVKIPKKRNESSLFSIFEDLDEKN